MKKLISPTQIITVSHYEASVWPADYWIGRSNTNTGSSLEHLRAELSAKVFPHSVPIPFGPKNVFLLSDKATFLLFSTHGKACRFVHGTATEFETSFITKNEVRLMTMLNDSEVVVAEARNRKVLRACLTECKKTFKKGPLMHIYHLATGQSKYYILTSVKLFEIAIEDNSVTVHQFWAQQGIETSHAIEMDLQEEESGVIAAILTRRPAVHVYSLSTREILTTIQDLPLTHLARLTAEYLICACVSDLHVYHRGSWEWLFCIQTRTTKVTCMSVSPSEHVLAIGSKEGYLQLWNIGNWSLKPQKFIGCAEPIENIKFVDDSQLYFYSSELSQLMLLNIPDFYEELWMPLSHPVKDVLYLPLTQKLVLNLRSGGVLKVDAQTLQAEERFLERTNFSMVISKNKRCVVALRKLAKSKRIKVLKLRETDLSIQNKRVYFENSAKWWANCIGIDQITGNFLVCFAEGVITIVSSTLSMIRDCRVHDCEITAISTFNNQSCSISGDVQGSVIQYDLKSSTVLGRYVKHSAPITALAVSSDDSLLLSGSEDGVLKISQVASQQCLSKLKSFESPIAKVSWTHDSQHFSTSTADGVFAIWDFRTKTRLMYLTGYTTFLFFNNEQQLCLAGQSSVLVMPNPLLSQSLVAYGPGDEEEYQYFKYVNAILSNQVPPYLKKWNDWLILPYKVNLAHLFAYFNLTKRLKAALADGILFVEDRNGHSPIDICCSLRSPLLTDVLALLIQEVQNNYDAARFFEGRLAKINWIGSSKLPALYEALFCVLKRQELPKYCDSKISLPIIQKTEELHTLLTSELAAGELSVGKPILFKGFLVRMDFDFDSRKSIEFLESLNQSPNTEVFRNEFIGLLLTNRWRQLRWVTIVQGCVYFMYLSLLLIYISSRSAVWFFATLTLSGLLTIYEVVLMMRQQKAYATDPFSIINTVRGVLCIMYAALLFVTEDQLFKNYVLLALSVASFIRGILFFRIFSATRYMSFLIKEVIKDMASFSLVLVYTLIAVAAAYLCVDDRDHGFMTVLSSSYLLGLGDVPLDGLSEVEQLVSIVGTVIITIVMMNLLISILGDTFDRVQQGLVEADRKSICEMLIEVERLRWRPGRLSRDTFFVACLDDFSTRKGGNWKGKVNMVVQEFGKHHKSTMSAISSTQDRIAGLEQKLEEYWKAHEQDLSELQRVVLASSDASQQQLEALTRQLQTVLVSPNS